MFSWIFIFVEEGDGDIVILIDFNIFDGFIYLFSFWIFFWIGCNIFFGFFINELNTIFNICLFYVYMKVMILNFRKLFLKSCGFLIRWFKVKGKN